MTKLSTSALADETGFSRKTISLRLEGVPFEDGPGGAKLYRLKDALQRLYGAGDGDGKPSARDAGRDLAVARKQQIELEMEVTRKTRIPIEDVQEVVGEQFANIRGALIARHDKTMTTEAINDLLEELRGFGARAKEKFDHEGQPIKIDAPAFRP